MAIVVNLRLSFGLKHYCSLNVKEPMNYTRSKIVKRFTQEKPSLIMWMWNEVKQIIKRASSRKISFRRQVVHKGWLLSTKRFWKQYFIRLNDSNAMFLTKMSVSDVMFVYNGVLYVADDVALKPLIVNSSTGLIANFKRQTCGLCMQFGISKD